MRISHCPLPRATWLGACLVAVLVRSAVADTSISASVAGLFVGQERVVEDTVTAGERDANTVRLRLGRPPQHLTVSLVLGLVNDFPPDPERYYVGKTVRVVGMIRSFRGAPEVVVHDVADIRVVEAASGANRPASGAVDKIGEAATQDRLNALGERVRSLEERVRQLERERPRPETP